MIRRKNTSITKATWTKPVQVATYVTSTTRGSLRRLARNCRFTKSSGRGERSSAGRDSGKTLLVLDTLTGGDADRLCTRPGWQRVGDVPGYALLPRGGLCSTTFFYRRLDAGGEG